MTAVVPGGCPQTSAALTHAQALRRAARALAGALLVYAVALALMAQLSPPRWDRPAGITDGQVRDAVHRWLAACLRARTGMPPGCPLEAADSRDPSNDRFEWGPGDSLVASESPVRWSERVPLFAVDGMFALRVRHEQAGGDGVPRTYVLSGTYPFSVALRPLSDRRDLGAYGAPTGRPVVDGFAITDYSRRWRWNCCSPEDPVWKLHLRPAAAVTRPEPAPAPSAAARAPSSVRTRTAAWRSRAPQRET